VNYFEYYLCHPVVKEIRVALMATFSILISQPCCPGPALDNPGCTVFTC